MKQSVFVFLIAFFCVENGRGSEMPLKLGDTFEAGNLGEPRHSMSEYMSANTGSDGANRREQYLAVPFFTQSTEGTPSHFFKINHVTMFNPIRSQADYVEGTHFIAIYDTIVVRSSGPGVFLPPSVVEKPNREIGRFLGSAETVEIVAGSFSGQLEEDPDEQHRFHHDANHPIVLKPNTRYWLVQGMQNVDGWHWISSFTPSTEQERWLVGDRLWKSVRYGRGTRVWSAINYWRSRAEWRTMRFGFDVTVIPEKGDLNLDGAINLYDIVRFNDHLNGERELPDSILRFADMNANWDHPYHHFNNVEINSADKELLLDCILDH